MALTCVMIMLSVLIQSVATHAHVYLAILAMEHTVKVSKAQPNLTEYYTCPSGSTKAIDPNSMVLYYSILDYCSYVC